MKKATKTLLCVGMISSMVMGSATTALAGTWRLGTGENAARWWYDFDNGSYAAGGWATIDGNGDGIAETYFFDAEGWMLADTVTPDGQTVNADGAWVVNGAVVQTNLFANAVAETPAANGYLWMYKTDEAGALVENAELMDKDYYDDWKVWTIAAPTTTLTGAEGRKDMITRWAQESERGAAWKALFDRYELPYGMIEEMSPYDLYTDYEFRVTTPGLSSEETYSVESALHMMLRICSADSALGSYTYETGYNADGTITVNVHIKNALPTIPQSAGLRDAGELEWLKKCDVEGDFQDYLANASGDSVASRIESWAQKSERGAAWKKAIDYFGIQDAMIENLSDTNKSSYSFSVQVTGTDMMLSGYAIRMMSAICLGKMPKMCLPMVYDSTSQEKVSVPVSVIP